MNEDPIHRAGRWKLFYEEDGGLHDMLTEIRTAYLERMSQVEPWETGKLAKLAIANKVTIEVETMVRDILNTGAVRAAQKAHIDRIEKLPEAKRRWI